MPETGLSERVVRLSLIRRSKKNKIKERIMHSATHTLTSHGRPASTLLRTAVLGVIYSRASPTAGCHLQPGVTCSRVSPTVRCHLQSGVTYSRVSPTDGCQLQTGVSYSRASPTVGCHLQRGAAWLSGDVC